MKKFFICTITAVSILTASCGYYPHLTGIPLIKGKGDTRIDGGVSLMHPVNVSVSYGVTDKIAVQAAANIMGGSYGHGAIGYFKNLQNRTVMEVYGGVGYGYSKTYKDAHPGWLYGNYQTYFTQINLGSIKKANFEYGIGLKVGYQHSNMTDEYYFFNDHPQNKNEPYPVYSLNGILVEPTAMMRVGGPKMKFHVSLGTCKWYQITHTDKKLPGWPFNLGMGFSYSFFVNKR